MLERDIQEHLNVRIVTNLLQERILENLIYKDKYGVAVRDVVRVMAEFKSMVKEIRRSEEISSIIELIRERDIGGASLIKIMSLISLEPCTDIEEAKLRQKLICGHIELLSLACRNNMSYTKDSFSKIEVYDLFRYLLLEQDSSKISITTGALLSIREMIIPPFDETSAQYDLVDYLFDSLTANKYDIALLTYFFCMESLSLFK